jgi:PEP-CTERM motif
MKRAIYGMASVLALGIASPATAAVTVCGTPSCQPAPSETVQVTPNSSPVVGTTNQTNTGVRFTSSTDTLVAPSAGASRVEAADGLLNQLTFSLANSFTFTAAEFNLSPLPGNNPLTEATTVIISFVGANGVPSSQTISGEGQNFINILATGGDRLTSVSFLATTPAGAGVNDLRQLRIGGIQAPGAPAVPEPATWAMMLVGFGAMGVSMRRRRRSTGEMLQVA